MPALIEPSPITAMTLLSSPRWSRAAQKPSAAEIEVAACAAPPRPVRRGRQISAGQRRLRAKASRLTCSSV
jgi:hypothetical protein